MSGAQQRLAVFPTRMTLNNTKLRLKGAQKGHNLLKRKSDALTIRFRQILQQIHAAKIAMGTLMKAGALALAELTFAAGDVSYGLREQAAGQTAGYRVKARVENVSGVQLPAFEALVEHGGVAADLTGLGRGGQQAQKCREVFMKALDSLVQLASLQTAFFILDDVIKTTNRRVNALEYVLLPRLENTINYISAELDEQDREEFFRLKKVQGKKRREREEEEAALAASASAIDYNATEILSYEMKDLLLESVYDPDIII
jgi:V-type H+-transporting ATPase subunit D